MIYKHVFKDENDGKDYNLYFMKTLNTEKIYRDELSTDSPVEFARDLATVISIIMGMEQHPDSIDSLTAYLDSNYATTRHDLLRFMFAQKNNDSDTGLVQNADTRKHFEDFENEHDVNEEQLIGAVLARFQYSPVSTFQAGA